MPNVVRAALIQARWVGDKDAMTKNAVRSVQQAAAEGAKVVCLQELFNGPYFCQVQDGAWYDWAEHQTRPRQGSSWTWRARTPLCSSSPCMRLRVLASSTARPQTGQPDGRLRTRRHSRPVLPARARREPHPAACRAVGYRGRPVHLMHDRATATFDAYRDNVIPTAAHF